MVNGGERHSDQTKPPEKGKGVKGASSLRAEQADARYGKAARHPLCLVALDLLRLDDELFKCTEEIELSEGRVKRTKQMKKNAQALIKQFREERNDKKANQVSALLRKVDRLLAIVHKRYQLAVQIRSKWQEMRPVPLALFKREYERVIRTRDAKACRALQRLRKRWFANEAHLKAGDLRKLETLNLLRDKVIKAAQETRGLPDGYLEAARGGERALSDEVWQGRLTAREIHSHIVAARGLRVAGDKDAKEIRRLARKLPLRLAKDKRGRKWKWPPPPKEQKQRRGRPRTGLDIIFVNDLEAIEARKAAAERGKTPVRGG
jgi:hypothetical protein